MNKFKIISEIIQVIAFIAWIVVASITIANDAVYEGCALIITIIILDYYIREIR